MNEQGEAHDEDIQERLFCIHINGTDRCSADESTSRFFPIIYNYIRLNQIYRNNAIN